MSFEEWASKHEPELSLAWSVHQGRFVWSNTQKFYECWQSAQSAQQSAHPTLGILAAFQAFIYAVKFSIRTAFRRPPQRR